MKHENSGQYTNIGTSIATMRSLLKISKLYASEKPDFNILTSNFEIIPVSIWLEI